MTVKELKEKLSKYNDDQLVTVFDSNIRDASRVHPVKDVDIDYADYICEENVVVVLYS